MKLSLIASVLAIIAIGECCSAFQTSCNPPDTGTAKKRELLNFPRRGVADLFRRRELVPDMVRARD